jgi:hypothetical protein
MIFKHLVGKSTLKEGLTISRDFEGWFESPEKGCKRQIKLIFEDDREVFATLRRLNNAVGHVQIKYETKRQNDFREWLNEKFKCLKDDKIRNGLLEFHKISQDIYKVNAIIEGEEKESKLKIEKQYFYREPEDFEEISVALSEINDIITGIDFKFNEKQSYYNQRMKEGFLMRNWECEKRVIRELGLKCDFRREKTQAEREIKYLEFMLNMPISIVGIDCEVL